MKDKKSLHPVQQGLLKLLTKNSDDPMTIREMQESLEVSSTSVIAHHLQQLEKKGFLKRNPYNTKDYMVIEGNKPESPIAHLNLYGMAACGPEGTVLSGDPLDKIAISSRLFSFPAIEAFMVKAKGNSMEPKIHEGDLVIARRTANIENSKVYVCVNKGEVMIKKVQVMNSAILLESFNKDVSTFIADEDFKVEGEVKGVLSGMAF